VKKLENKNHKGVTPTELGEYLGRSKITTGKNLLNLYRKGFLNRKREGRSQFSYEIKRK